MAVLSPGRNHFAPGQNAVIQMSMSLAPGQTPQKDSWDKMVFPRTNVTSACNQSEYHVAIADMELSAGPRQGLPPTLNSALLWRRCYWYPS